MKINWEEFLEGDNLVLAKLYDEVFLSLLFVSIRYTRDFELSRDIISDLFLTLIETPKSDRIKKWKEVRDIKSFLTILIRNKSIDAVRTKINRQQIREKIASKNTQYCEQEYFHQDHFEKSIALLNEKERELFLMHFNGFTNSEIGNKMSYSEKTVRNKLSLCRKKMIYFWKNLLLLILWKILN